MNQVSTQALCRTSTPLIDLHLVKRLSTFVLTLVALTCSAFSYALSPLNFNVWIDERKMGTHRYTFETLDSASDTFRVISEADFKVKVLLVTVFNYQHTAIETWRGNCLQALESETTTNGKEEEIDLELPAEDCAGTYTYWDKERLRRPMLTNTQTGKAEPTTWTDLGLVSLPTIGKKKNVKGHSGDVQGIALTTPSAGFRLYYSDTGELLMMQTENDSRTITYLHDSLKAK